MKGRATRFAVLLVLGVASVISYINDLDFLAAVFQILSLIVSKKIRYQRSLADCSSPSEVRSTDLFGSSHR